MRKHLFLLGVFLTLSLVSFAEKGFYTYSNGDDPAHTTMTYTIADAKLKWKLPNYTEGGVGCTAVQGMVIDADGKYCYVAKQRADTVCAIVRIDMNANTQTALDFYASKSATKPSNCINYFGHANSLEVVDVTVNGQKETWLFVATLQKPESVAVLKVDNDKARMYLLGYYSMYLPNGKNQVNASAMKFWQMNPTNPNEMWFIVKNSRKFYSAVFPIVPETGSLGTIGNPTHVKIYKLCEFDVRNALFAGPDGTGTHQYVQDSIAQWGNQGFDYKEHIDANDANDKKTIFYVPLWNGTKGKQKQSAILTYDASAFMDEKYWNPNTPYESNGRKAPIIFPTRTSLKLTDESVGTFEVEEVSFVGNTLYFNTNSDIPAKEGVYSVEISETNFTPVEKGYTNTYKIVYNANGGTGSQMENSYHIEGLGTRINPNTYTRKGYTFGGWYMHRDKDNKWLYYPGNTGEYWHEKGTQPIDAYLLPREDEHRFTHVTEKEGDEVTLYAYWVPKTTTKEYYYIRYDGNGGEGTMEETKMPYGTNTSYATNKFTRDGWTFVGWRPLRNQRGLAGAQASAMWGFKTYTNSTWGDDWFTIANANSTSTKAHIIKTFPSTGKGAKISGGTNGEVVTFYACWAQVDGFLSPTGAIEVGKTLNNFGGKVHCNTDLHSVMLRIKHGNDTVAYHTIETHSSRTGIPLPSVDGTAATAAATEDTRFDLADFNDKLTIPTTATAGHYTIEVVARPIQQSDPFEVVIHTAPLSVTKNGKMPMIKIPTENGAVELANPSYVTREAGKLTGTGTYTDTGTDTDVESYLFSADDKNWYEFTDPQRVGHKFVGWESVYVTNNQSLKSFQDKYLLFSQTNPIAIASTIANVRDENHSINHTGGIAGHNISDFTNNVTVNVWARMEDWTKYNSTMRLLSCYNTGGWGIGRLENKTKSEVTTEDNITSEYYIMDATLETPSLVYKKSISDMPLANLPSATTTTAASDTKPDTKGWRMFTFAFGTKGTTYTEAWTLVNGDYRGTSTDYGKAGKIEYNESIGLLVGGEIGGNSGLESGYAPFAGDIRNVVVSKIWDETTSWDYLKKFQDSYKTWLYTGEKEAYTLTPVWEKNAETGVKLKLVEADATDASAVKIAASPTEAKPAGTGAALATPTRPDHLFLHWTDKASHYVSNHQGIRYERAENEAVDTIFTRADDGRTNVVTFDGATHYFVKEDTDLGTYKHEDCFTVNVWATMEDWGDFFDESSAARLFSCAESGGFSIEPFYNKSTKKTENIISFVGRDGVANEYKRISAVKSDGSTYSWGDLSVHDTGAPLEEKYAANWHMFTYVWDGSYIRGYIDGECVGVSDRFATNVMTMNPNNNIVIGGEAAGSAYVVESGKHFKGQMRDFAIMHTALAPSQVADLYTSQLSNSPDIRYYYAPETVAPATADFTLEAMWQPLRKLSADNVTIHAIAGDEVSEKVSVTGNGVKKTIVELAAMRNVANTATLQLGNEKAGKVTLGSDEEDLIISYKADAYYDNDTDEDAPKNSFATTFVLSDESGSSTKKTYNVQAYTHKFDIAYWNAAGFAVQADADLAKCDITIKKVGDTEVITTTLGNESKGFDGRADGTYEIALTGKAATLSDTDIEITFTHPAGWTAKTTRSVPKFITQDEDLTTEINNSRRDVMIMGDVSLNADLTATEKALGDVYIHPEASLQLGKSGHLKARSLVLYSERDKSPSLLLPDNQHAFTLTGSVPTIYYVKRIWGDRYYFFSLPYDCQSSDIRFADGSAAVIREHYYIQYYDGAARANTNGAKNSWTHIVANKGDAFTLEAGKAYVVGLAGAATAQNDIIFPMKVTTGNRDLHVFDNQDKMVGVIAHSTEKTSLDNKGWNGIGNPYFASYAYQGKEGDNQTSLQAGYLKGIDVVLNGTNDPNAIYMTVPYPNQDRYYYQTVYGKTTIPPFGVFFVQAGKNETLGFACESRNPQSIVARKQAAGEVLSRSYAGITLSNSSFTDETALVIGDQFTQSYEIGSDLSKMLAEGEHPQVYINDNAYRYAFKSLSVADAAGTNDLGVYLPSNGEYTFAVNDYFDHSGMQAIYLTDKEAGVKVNLLQTPYTFTSGAVHTTSRFALSAVLSADVATDLTSGTAIAWSVWQDAPLHVQVQGLAVGDMVRVYDTMGHLILETVAHDTAVAFSLPAEGAYCIQTVGVKGVQVKKMMVK